MGVLALAVGAPAPIAWVSLGFGLLALAALAAVRMGWLRPRAPSGANRAATPAEPPPVHRTPIPSLSPADAALVDRTVAILGRAGVFAPEVPDPPDLYPAAADRDAPVSVIDVLRCVDEAAYWTPGFDPGRYCDNLAHHWTQVEQEPDYLGEQAADLARLAGGAVSVAVAEVRQDVPPDGGRRTPTRIRLVVAGRPLALDYAGTTKDLSTVLHVALSRALHAAGAPRRIAFLTEDGHLTLTGLTDRDLIGLNAELGLPPSDPGGSGGWTWIDETPPYAAGDDAAT